MDDDELIGRIRDANPSQARRDTPLSARAEHDLQQIISGNAGSPSRRTPKPVVPWAVAAVAVVALVMVIVITNLGQRMPASVAAPPPLWVTPIDHSLSDILGSLIVKTEQRTEITPAQTIKAESWAANITVDAGSASVAIQPQEVERNRKADLSGYVEVRAGTVRWGSAEGEFRPAGTILEHYDYVAGAYPLLFPLTPPDNSNELYLYLRSRLILTNDSSTGDIFRGIQDLRNEWALEGRQAAALLELVGSLPDVELLGMVTDRLGRDGVAIQTTTRVDGAFRDILVFDPDSGSLIAAESVYLGGAENVPLPENTVISYIAWKETG